MLESDVLVAGGATPARARILNTIAILGAGELGAALARRLADREAAGRVLLIDPELGRARGKALDIRQSGPIEGSDTQVEGCASLIEAGPADVVVWTDVPGAAAASVQELASRLGKAMLVVACDEPSLVELAVAAGVPRARAFGSAPLAWSAALRRRLAEALRAAPREVAAVLLGRSPHDLVLPRESATLGGIPIDRVSAGACRTALDGLRGRTLGPAALAAAAARAIEGLGQAQLSVLPLTAWLDGEYGHRGVALAVPAQLSRRGLQGVLEVPLDPVDRVAFDRAAQHALDERR
jgi:malate dehydrogenase